MLNQRAWEAALGAIQVEVPKADFAAWFRDANFIEASDANLVIGVPTVFAKETVERKYEPLLARTLAKAAGRNVRVTVVVRPKPAAASDEPLVAAPTDRVDPSPAPATEGLHPRFTFGNFVVGTSNRLAHAAALRVSEAPGQAYNPLFIYSGVGLGKTHLLHAIGHAILTGRPDARVRYVSCETFTNDLLLAIRTDVRGERTRRFRERYRSVDVLLIDDVEFLSRTETSQEELFHTFNALYEADRQIVLTSDRPPGEIPRLEDRLRSRFEAGLVADIQAPDLDLRRALLEIHAVASGATVPSDVVDYIANRVRRNVRELEGALTRTLIFSELNDLPLTPTTAAQALDGLALSARRRPPTPQQVLETVGAYFDIPVADLTGPRRDARVAGARQLAMFLMRNDSGLTLPAIGRVLGDRDHTTVLYGCKKTERRLQLDDEIKRDLEGLRARLAEAS